MRLHLHQLGVVVAERVVRLQPHAAGIAHALSREGALHQLEDSVVAAVQVFDRLLGLLDQAAVGAVELVGKPDDGVFRYLHLPPRFRRPSTSTACPRGLTP